MFPPSTPSWSEVVETLWAPGIGAFVAALVIALLATPVFRAIAVRRGIVDRPDQAVKIHKAPIPYLGGCAIWLAWTVPMVVHLAWLRAADQPAGPEIALIAGGAVAFLVGLLDDLYDLPPKLKLVGQAAAGGVLLAGGIMWRAFPNLDWLPAVQLGPDSTIALVFCVAMHFFVVLGATNATNLLDGLDGLVSGVSSIISVGFLLMATSLTAWALWGSAPAYEYTRLIMIVAMALTGAAIGFLPYNFNPARIFMGDAGSIFLGYVMAAMMIMFASRFGMVKWFVGSLFIFGLPIFDTAMALLRRVVNRRPILMPDRSHLYNQLIDRLGLGVRGAVAVSYGLSLFFAAAGLLVLYMNGRWAMALYVALAAGFLVAVWRLGLLRMTPEDQAAADRYLERRRRDGHPAGRPPD